MAGNVFFFPGGGGGNSHINRTGMLWEIVKRNPKTFQDSGLWALLDIFPTPKRF